MSDSRNELIQKSAVEEAEEAMVEESRQRRRKDKTREGGEEKKKMKGSGTRLLSEWFGTNLNGWMDSPCQTWQGHLYWTSPSRPIVPHIVPHT
jgi:hypothetical protein